MSLVNIRHYNEWPFKIVYASNGNSLRQTLETLNGFYREHPHIPLFKRPNLIHVIGKYFVYRVLPGGEEAKDGTTLTENTFLMAIQSPLMSMLSFVQWQRFRERHRPRAISCIGTTK